MEYVLLALAVALPAFFICLTVLVLDRRERWAKWALAATLIMGGVLLYYLVIPIETVPIGIYPLF